ncbi:uncharacterized protein LOC122498377 [Leptopilina heterotoma]|uniref:uncharacterized protein LOC122498377 n=1 Tax=Leptopilina heterotoma TaxID=63436 RepID=UPI001CA8A3CC|nr:uncharacterized protein LOC122498377 [Leptopilina heterotoma]
MTKIIRSKKYNVTNNTKLAMQVPSLDDEISDPFLMQDHHDADDSASDCERQSESPTLQPPSKKQNLNDNTIKGTGKFEIKDKSKIPREKTNKINNSINSLEGSSKTSAKSSSSSLSYRKNELESDTLSSSLSSSHVEVRQSQLDEILAICRINEMYLKELLNKERILNAKVEQLLSDKNVVSKYYNFAEEHKLGIPFQEMEDFEKFEESLLSNDFKVKFESSLSMHFDSTLNTRKTITNILKKYFSKNLALNFVAMKVTGDKKIFKNTMMFTSMLNAISDTHKDHLGAPIVEGTFLNELKNVLPNVKDWEGGRKSRHKEPE